MLKENDKLITANNDICEIFNDCFTNISTTIGFDDSIVSTEHAIEIHANHPSVIKIKDVYKKHGDRFSFSFNYVKQDEVRKKLSQINVKKSTGYDHIPGKILCLAHNALANPFTSLMNACIENSKFPSELKYAELSPLFKKSDNLLKENYRPVSILTAISKIHEDLMNDQLYAYFEDIFEELPSAFRKKYSCQSLLTKFIDNWKIFLDSNQVVGAVFMDLSKAFDCLPYSLIIAKLHAYGLSFDACKFLSSYLSGRHQRVKIQNHRSNWKLISKGVPQGSILGPLLFNIFMNDMFLFIEHCNLYNYADDNSMSATAESIDEAMALLKVDCENAVSWFTSNGMKANPGKFQFMIISPHDVTDKKPELLVNDVVLKAESSVKVLGITIDSRLNFSEHVSNLCTKAARQLNSLARISRYIDETSRYMIYNSFVRSNFNFCPMVWHFCGIQNNEKLERIQERALRIVYGDYSSSYDDLLSHAKTHTLMVKRLRQMLFEAFKSIGKKNSNCLNDMFEIKELEYALRKNVNVVQPKRKTLHLV